MAATGTSIEISGIPEVDDALSYLSDKSARRFGRRAAGKMATIYASGIRRFIPKSLRPETSDRGIGSRSMKAIGGMSFRAKAGIRVGKAAKNALTKLNRGGRKGVGMSANNLHWPALGTKDRYTGAKKSGSGVKRTGHKRRFTGRLDKQKWGGFVQAGVTATELPAIEAARKTAFGLIDQEAARARRGG